ncbi:MAG TPA: 4Fe-4S dicluster domain-containing protein, partial [Burkholderiaceae bacterium]|nr:4Fe-4S dicluster domain-containing protein [Burkholderiaceae bacterium]
DWSDARSHDGTPSIVQPVISPLYGGRSPHTLASLLATGQTISAHERVRTTWRGLWHEEGDDAFEDRWRTALGRGVIEGVPGTVKQPQGSILDEPPPRRASTAGAPSGDALVAVFANDSNLITGEYANNAWLQELPRPYTKITWDNAALISPATAQSHGLHSGDVVVLTATDAPASVRAPVWILTGQADGVVTLPLGYGRGLGGSTAAGHGFDAYPLQAVQEDIPQRTRVITMTPTGDRHDFARTQHDMDTHGREPARVVELRRNEASRNATAAPPSAARGAATPALPPRSRPPAPSLYPDHEYNTYAWGMTVDLDACIGCNACVVACQAENNIPVVGPEQVSLGREMLWLRIDSYRDETRHRTQFQPMACQHCENAPCEVVCPVGATMHDSEGLNVQVYNRCVGTRFCSNNCPYKVRHFNFFQYSLTDPSSAAHANPDVTVRQRGVMEKCTYCVQRISHARIQSQKERRRIRDGEVVTACQATCPTDAIVFGDMNDPDSQVSRSKSSSRGYAVLEEMNTRPRTTYLARIDDPEAGLEDDDDRKR